VSTVPIWWHFDLPWWHYDWFNDVLTSIQNKMCNNDNDDNNLLIFISILWHLMTVYNLFDKKKEKKRLRWLTMDYKEIWGEKSSIRRITMIFWVKLLRLKNFSQYYIWADWQFWKFVSGQCHHWTTFLLLLWMLCAIKCNLFVFFMDALCAHTVQVQSLTWILLCDT
jgi:hypothetical protein